MSKEKLVIEIECEDTKTIEILTKIRAEYKIKTFSCEEISSSKKVGF